jgi:hypothetical protein
MIDRGVIGFPNTYVWYGIQAVSSVHGRWFTLWRHFMNGYTVSKWASVRPFNSRKDVALMQKSSVSA